MATQITNITNEPHQIHTVLTDDGAVTLTLRFLPAVEIWILSVDYKGILANGVKLSAGVSHLRAFNYPFDVAIVLTDHSGIDPFKADDFSSGRCELYFAGRAEMFKIRGIEVPI
jgi:hypothetical protein